MVRCIMRIAVLTSSRADYSIYLPLLKKLKNEPQFELQIIAFGTHVSGDYGMTKTAITQDGFNIAHALPEFIYGDQPKDIVKSMGMTTIEIGKIFEMERYDLIFALGDRFEMFAAVSAATAVWRRQRRRPRQSLWAAAAGAARVKVEC